MCSIPSISLLACDWNPVPIHNILSVIYIGVLKRRHGIQQWTTDPTLLGLSAPGWFYSATHRISGRFCDFWEFQVVYSFTRCCFFFHDRVLVGHETMFDNTTSLVLSHISLFTTHGIVVANGP